VAVRLVAGLALLVALGTAALLLPGIGARRPLQPNEALFVATSALTTTGLTLVTPGSDLTLFGQAVLLILMQLGGIGFMVAAAVALRLLGRRISLLDRLALRDSLDLVGLRAVRSVARRVLLTVLAIEAAGAVLLWVNWRGLGGGRPVAFYAVFHAVSAFSNASFDLFVGSDDLPAGVPTDPGTLAILGALIFLGGLGVPVLADLLAWPTGPRRRRLRLHTRVTLVVSGLLVLGGWAGLALVEGWPGGLLAAEPLPRRLLLALFQSVAARTAGFNSLAGFEGLAPASQLLLMGLMFVGAAPASMGGGVSTGVAAVLALGLTALLRGADVAQVGGRQIPADAVRRAAAILTVSLLVVVAATWLILATHPVALGVALFEVVSAFATCGFTLAFTGQLHLPGQLVIALVMFWGRVGPLTLIVALALPRRAPALTYPEEQLLLG
jgi:trk system potassium uptake protein TrkH